LDFVIGRYTSMIDSFDKRERQDALSRLGFSSYKDYLKSETWKGIKERVLKRDLGKCRRCGDPATQVHHAAYDIATLHGECLLRLYSACSRCHLASHSVFGEARVMNKMSKKERARKNRRKKRRRKISNR